MYESEVAAEANACGHNSVQFHHCVPGQRTNPRDGVNIVGNNSICLKNDFACMYFLKLLMSDLLIFASQCRCEAYGDQGIEQIACRAFGVNENSSLEQVLAGIREKVPHGTGKERLIDYLKERKANVVSDTVNIKITEFNWGKHITFTIDNKKMYHRVTFLFIINDNKLVDEMVYNSYTEGRSGREQLNNHQP